ncbi:MAG: hypothetical protein JSR82_14070 [Verrucomicrobia bacterium]|nr:hypothetical protein [Verrucomicrobiota bacterium]
MGSLPVNLLALAGFGILGLVEPVLWLLGAGLETAYLFTLASNRRFQQFVDAQAKVEELAQDENSAHDWRTELLRLDPRRAERCQTLEAAIDATAEHYRKHDGGEALLESNLTTLRRLAAMHVELSLAAARIEAAERSSNRPGIERQIAELQREAETGGLTEATRESKLATADLLRRRLANSERRRAQLEELSAHLERIESQVQLALDDAASHGAPAAVQANLGAYEQIIASNQEIARSFQAQ